MFVTFVTLSAFFELADVNATAANAAYHRALCSREVLAEPRFHVKGIVVLQHELGFGRASTLTCKNIPIFPACIFHLPDLYSRGRSM